MANKSSDFLTVEETARVLRIRRTAAYQLVRHDLATGGSDGLRVRRFGKLFRVPRAALEELTGCPLSWPLPDDEPEVIELDTHRRTGSTPAAPSAAKPSRSSRRSRRLSKRSPMRRRRRSRAVSTPAG